MDIKIIFVLEITLPYEPLLIKEFDIPVPGDSGFWLELDVYYMPETNRSEIYLRGSDIPVMVVNNKLVFNVNKEILGVITSKAVPATLNILYEFSAMVGLDVHKISRVCDTLDSYHDFIISVFTGIKNIPVKHYAYV